MPVLKVLINAHNEYENMSTQRLRQYKTPPRLIKLSVIVATLCWLISSGLVASAEAATISGVVKNSQSSAPISGVAVTTSPVS
ncbi:MAG: hypothetical protein ACI8P9_000736 [Parasphingorhabdus sp.]|jgi:hypothetical protein